MLRGEEDRSGGRLSATDLRYFGLLRVFNVPGPAALRGSGVLRYSVVEQDKVYFHFK